MLENVQRADLTFLEEADAINHLLNEHKFTQEELAKKLGKSQSAIANKLRLLRLSPEIKNMIIRNNLTERHARAILRLPIDELRIKALKNICTYNYNVQQTDELVDRMLERIRGEVKTPKGKIKGVVQLRTFINTINKAVDVVKKAGVEIETQKEEKESFVEYVIKIPKLGQGKEITIE
jgi:ParB family chromosome partitioning protein